MNRNIECEMRRDEVEKEGRAWDGVRMLELSWSDLVSVTTAIEQSNLR